MAESTRLTAFSVSPRPASASPYAVDIDGNGTGGEATFFGRGTVGRAQNHAVTDVVFSSDPCECDNGVCGVTLLVIQHTNILVDRKGDLLYRMLSSDPASTVCVNFFAGTANLTAHLDVTGGTGRFEGATGSTVLKTEIRIVGLQNSVTGTEEGWVFGVNDDDSDSDSD